MKGQWHFDRTLIVLSEQAGIGNIKKQSFTYTSFWVQIHNIPIMFMNRDAIQKLGEKIGTVKEVEKDETWNALVSLRVRISIDITQPLKKVVSL